MADRAVADELLDAAPGRATGAGDVDRREARVGRHGSDLGTDAVADLLQQERVLDRGRELVQPRGQAHEVLVAGGLHRLLQRVRVQRERVRSDRLDRPADMLGPVAVVQLGDPEVADQQHVRGERPHLEAAGGGRVLEHDALRAEHEPDAELLRRLGEVPVDRAGAVGAARHRADQERSAQRAAEELRRQVDVAEIGLRQRPVRQVEGFEAGGARLVLDPLRQARVQVRELARARAGGIRAGLVAHRSTRLRRVRRAHGF